MTKTQAKNLLISLIAGSVVFAVHFSIQRLCLPKIHREISLWTIYGFILGLSVLLNAFVIWRYHRDHSSAGRSYFITVFIKLFASIFFLWPWITAHNALSKPFAVHYLCAFFALLFIETILLVRMLNRPLDEKTKNDENQ